MGSDGGGSGRWGMGISMLEEGARDGGQRVEVEDNCITVYHH